MSICTSSEASGFNLSKIQALDWDSDIANTCSGGAVITGHFERAAQQHQGDCTKGWVEVSWNQFCHIDLAKNPKNAN